MSKFFWSGAGMMFCNLPKMMAKQGERVRFHIFTLGTEDDLHSPSLLASSFLADVRPLQRSSFSCSV